MINSHQVWVSRDLSESKIVKIWNKEPRESEGSYSGKEYLGYSCIEVWEKNWSKIELGECKKFNVSFSHRGQND